MHARSLRLALPTILAGAIAACSQAPSMTDASNDVAMDAGFDVSPDAPGADAADVATFETGPHMPPPQLPNQGGPVITMPSIVTITFANDPNRATFESFGQWIVQSQWLAAVGADYDVHPGGMATQVERMDNAPSTVTDTQIQTLLVQGITDGSIATPAGLANTLLVIYYPHTTAITYGGGGQVLHVCTDSLGYHGELQQGSLQFTYVVVNDCAITAITGLTPLEVVEETASHELVEGATNPHDVSNPAWTFAPADPSAWAWLGPENGDLCARPHVWIRDGNFVAQRIWSNTAAAAGLDPCVPADPTMTYFNTDAEPSDLQMAAAGQTLTFDLAGWSLGPVDDWTVTGTTQGTVMPTLAPSSITLNNGGTATLQVTVPSTAQRGDYSVITLRSHPPTGNYHEVAIGFYVP